MRSANPRERASRVHSPIFTLAPDLVGRLRIHLRLAFRWTRATMHTQSVIVVLCLG